MESLTDRMLRVTLRGRPYRFNCGSTILARPKERGGLPYARGTLDLHDNGMRFLTSKQGMYDILYEDIIGIYVFDYSVTILLRQGTHKVNEIKFNHALSILGRKPESVLGSDPVSAYKQDIDNFVAELTKKVNIMVLTHEDLL